MLNISKATPLGPKSDFIFGKFDIFSMSMMLKIKGVYGIILAKNRVKVYRYFVFL